MKLARSAGVLALTAIAGTATGQDAASGRELYFDFCATCHGAEARGDGPMTEILLIRPADLTSLRRENAGVYPVFRVVRQIDGRDPLLAHGGTMPLYGSMFPFEDTAIIAETGQPILTSRAIADLSAWLETIQE